MVSYPVLVGEMAKNEITRKEIAELLRITERTMVDKMKGIKPFKWDEVETIHDTYFADIDVKTLMSRKDIKLESSDKPIKEIIVTRNNELIASITGDDVVAQTGYEINIISEQMQ